MVRPKNWKDINAARWNFYIDLFDDMNKILDDCRKDCMDRIEKARMDLHDLFQKRAHVYGEKFVRGKNSKMRRVEEVEVRKKNVPRD